MRALLEPEEFPSRRRQQHFNYLLIPCIYFVTSNPGFEINPQQSSEQIERDDSSRPEGVQQILEVNRTEPQTR